MKQKQPFTGSEIALRKRMLGCECGVVGQLLLVNNAFVCGHFCKISGKWTMKNLPAIKPEDMYELYDKIHHIGIG